MRPLTEFTPEEAQFARNVINDLLEYINIANSEGRPPFVVSHAWSEGPTIYLVYKAPPSDIIWGLVRDTRESLIDPAPWPDLEEAVRYYYLLDLDENRMSASFRQPGEFGTIFWRGDPQKYLPQRPTDIPEEHRFKPAAAPSPVKLKHDERHRTSDEPRRYVDPQEL
ncbi:MAG: hypothetical protein EKK34_28005 [Mycobacterium sp.]|nr:MAG: hypothetical protein EKK34_28005 [Mycobacterium sp.]